MILGYYVNCDDAVCTACVPNWREGFYPGWSRFESWPDPLAITDESGSASDTPTHCEWCEALIEHPLTPHGQAYVAERIVDLLTNRSGRKEIIGQWAETYNVPEELADTPYGESVLKGHMTCALWSSTFDANEDGLPADHETDRQLPMDSQFERCDIALEAADEMRGDCARFVLANIVDLIGMDPEQVGHDFWLTRNHHGAGFWDRGLGDAGERLTKAAHVYGEQVLYFSSDQLYV